MSSASSPTPFPMGSPSLGLPFPPLPIAPASLTVPQPALRGVLPSYLSHAWVNKASIACTEKEHTALCTPDSPRTAFQLLPGPLACSLHPLGSAFPPPEILSSSSCLPHWSQFLLWLSSAALFIFFLSHFPTPSCSPHSWIWVFCGLLIRTVPTEWGRKEAQSNVLTFPFQ